MKRVVQSKSEKIIEVADVSESRFYGVELPDGARGYIRGVDEHYWAIFDLNNFTTDYEVRDTRSVATQKFSNYVNFIIHYYRVFQFDDFVEFAKWATKRIP